MAAQTAGRWPSAEKSAPRPKSGLPDASRARWTSPYVQHRARSAHRRPSPRDASAGRAPAPRNAAGDAGDADARTPFLTEVPGQEPVDEHVHILAEWDDWVRAQRQDLDLVALDAPATPGRTERAARALNQVDTGSTWRPPMRGAAAAAPALGAPLPSPRHGVATRAVSPRDSTRGRGAELSDLEDAYRTQLP